MKKQTFLLSLLGLFLLGCSSEDSIVDNEENQPSGPVTRSFLSVNIVASSNAATRADGTYEDGDSKEGNVNAVRFFFFDEDGEAAPISKRNGTQVYQSYIDWYPTASDSDSGDKTETVERVLKATLGISVPGESAEKKYPTQVLAILNPTSEILNLGTTATPTIGPDLKTLVTEVADFKTELDNDNFVMSNSVYVVAGETSKPNVVVKTTSLAEENFAATAEEAEDNKVTIYVERVLARHDLSIRLEAVAGKEGVYKTKDSEYGLNGENSIENKNIYVKFLGWNITCTPKESRLVKDFSGDWAGNTFGLTNGPWNAANYHRSFWAINPTLSYQEDYQFCSYKEISHEIPKVGSTKKTYMQENAAESATSAATAHPTQVIVKAQLVDENEQPITIAKWANRMYTLDGVKTAIANVLNLYTENANGTYVKIVPGDVHFATWQQLYGDEEKDPNEGNYYVYAKVDENTTWYQKTGEEFKKISYAEVKKYVRDVVNHVMVWNEGQTYYYFEIRHLGEEATESGYYGVVRNHIYRSTITELAGLGTPVYDPDEEIIPEKPEDDTMLSAEIKILQWRVVSHNYELNW